MNCDRVRPSLASYAGGELGSETTAWVDSHISSCPECSAIVARHRQIGAVLREVTLREIEPPAALVGEVMAKVGRTRRIIPVPIPPPELVRAVQENREQIVSTTGTVLAAGAAAWLLYRAAKSIRDSAKPKPGLA